ncbi:MAG: hypothetical protein AMS16_04815 [Planctomycetes bacterium DG_58]|nr:MAG: hypothetical protein AMS16_04815 [Planctomycetes bacterium DG_58]
MTYRFEGNRVSTKDDLKRLGIGASWRVVVVDSPSAAERIAAEELCTFLRREGIEVELVPESDAPRERRIVLSSSGDGDDGYRLKRTGDEIVVSGNNPRSVLYGVYRLIDWLRGDRDSDELDLTETPYFRERWMTPTLHGRTDDERSFRYLARLGVNTTYLRGRRDPFVDITHFCQYVTDTKHLPEISRAAPPHAQMVEMVDGAYRLARSHGMSIVMLQDDPVAIPARDSKSDMASKGLPPELADRLDPEMLGRAWLPPFRADGWKALSVFHPKVEAHYAELLTQVLKRWPEVRILYLYNEDCAAANCYPPDEPTAAEHYPEGYDGYPYAAHLHLAKLLQEVGRRLNPDFRVATVTYHWYQPEELRRKMVAGIPADSVLITLAAWDDSVDTSVLPGWTQDLCRQVKGRADVVFLADDDFSGTSDDLLMEITAGFPMPIRTYKKMHTWARAGAVGVTQHHTGGPTLGVNGIADLAWRVFSWDPLMTAQQAEAVIAKLTRTQLGDDAAADEMMLAYKAVDRALDAVEATVDNRPYGSRLHHSLGRFMFPPHLQEGLRRTGESTADYCGDGIDPEVWHDTLTREVAAYAEALEHATRAAELAPTDRSPFYLYFETDEPMSCAEYAQVAANAVEIVLRFKQTFLNFLDAEKLHGDQLVEAWRKEKTNVEALVKALNARRRWMQSPYGMEILEKLIARLTDKLQRLAVHGV